MLKNKSRTHQSKRGRISWPDVYFAAEANREAFEDVSVATLDSYLVDMAYEIAINEVGLEDSSILVQRAHEILTKETVSGKEHVDVSGHGINVVIDRKEIDEDALWDILDMVATALDKLDGKFGKIYFGESKRYKPVEYDLLNLH